MYFVEAIHSDWVLPMELPTELKAIDGAEELYQWFGFWPSFPDAEVVSLRLNRRAPSSLIIHTWEMTKEVDEQGYFGTVKHIVVEFTMDKCGTSPSGQTPSWWLLDRKDSGICPNGLHLRHGFLSDPQ